MGKALMVSGQAWTTSNGSEFTVFGSANPGTTELNSQASCTEDATFSNIRARTQSGNSGTATYVFRDAGANGNQTFQITGAASGEDATNTDVLSAGDLFNIAYTDTGTNSVNTWFAANVTLASGHGNIHGTLNPGGIVFDAASSTRFIGIAGAMSADGSATEDNVEWKTRGYTSYEALQVRVTANARTNNSDFKNRINAGDGTGLVQFTSGATGLISDTAIGDVITDGQTVNVSITLDTGLEDLAVTLVAATLKSSSDKSETWILSQAGFARTASATESYTTIGGHLFSFVTETNARVKPGFAAVVSNLRCYLSANTYTGDGTLKLYQNGVAVITTTITASGGAAWYENTSDTITIDADDELSFEFDEGTSGSITIHSAGITFAPAATTIAVGAGSLAFTGQAPTVLVESPGVSIPVGAGTVALTGQAVIFDQGFGVGVGVLTLTGQTPLAAFGFPVAQDELLFTGLVPSAEVTYNVSVGAGIITFAGQTPSAGFGFAVGAVALAFTGQVPLVAVGFAVGAGSVAAAGQAPTAGFGFGVGEDALVLSGLAPVTDVGFNITLGTGALTLTGQVPSAEVTYTISIEAGALVLSGQTPVSDFGFGVGPDVLTISGTAPSMEAAFPVGAGTLVFSGFAPSITADVVVDVGTGILTLTGLTPSPAVPYIIGVAAASLTALGYSPDVRIAVILEPGELTVLLNGQVPGLAFGYAVDAGTLSLGGAAPASDFGFGVGAGVLNLSGATPTAFEEAFARPGAAAITLSGFPPSIVTGADQIVLPAAAALFFTGQTPTAVEATAPGLTDVAIRDAVITALVAADSVITTLAARDGVVIGLALDDSALITSLVVSDGAVTHATLLDSLLQ